MVVQAGFSTWLQPDEPSRATRILMPAAASDPTASPAGQIQSELRFTLADCYLGSVLIAATEPGLCAIFLGEDPSELVRNLERRFPRSRPIRDDKKLDALASEIIAFIENPSLGFHRPLDIRGTDFQKRVWQALRRIPIGKTATYADIARAIGAPKAVRAVAQACGANPLAVVIPCHRVLRSDGDISGYRWGVERKRKLLESERLAHSAQSA